MQLLFLDKIPRWEPDRPHHPCLYQRMFAHAEAAGWKEYDCKICQGSLAAIAEKRPPGRGSCHGVVNTGNHLGGDHGFIPPGISTQRNPREVPFSEDTAEETCIEILETLKEHLPHRWSPAQLERELRQTCLNQIPWQSTGSQWPFWPILRQTVGVPGGSPKGGKGCSLPGTGHGSHAGGTHRVAEPLCLSQLAW